MFKRFLLGLLVAFTICCTYLYFKDFNRSHEIIFLDGTIITINDKQPYADAIFVRDGKIIDVGNEKDILKYKTKNTLIYSLKGKTLLPGFFDAHSHFDISTIMYDLVDITGFSHRTSAAVWKEVSDRVKKSSQGNWIFCYGYDPILTKDLAPPTIEFLDSIAPNNPLVLISQTLHFYYVNTKAFKEAGISESMAFSEAGSYYEKDSNGKFTGLVVEQKAFEPFRLKMQELLLKDFAENASKQLKNYAANGITSIVSMGLTTSNPKIITLYKHLSAERASFSGNLFELLGKLPKREPNARHFVYLRDRDKNLLPANPLNQDDYFRIAGIKLWYDGSPYVGSMYIDEPYLSSDYILDDLHLDSAHRGEALISQHDFEQTVLNYQKMGWPVAVHAQGDKAINEVINSFTEINKHVPIDTYRHRLEHCLLLPRDKIEFLPKLGLSVSFHINHLLYYGDFLESDIIGKDRTQSILPVYSVSKTGIPFSLHADAPMFKPEPFSLISTAVKRRTESGTIINGDEVIDIISAIKSITLYSAWQVGLEDKLGSIEKGKYADFVVLDKNPLTAPPDSIGYIKVIETFVAGNSIWKR